MNMMINILCDANVSCDTLFVKVAQAADLVCQPIIKESETNGNDVLIVGIICLAIVIIALIAKWALWSWKDAEIKAATEERGKKESEAVIAERKQNSDLLNKRLEILKELCYDIKEVGQGENSKEAKTQKTLKPITSEEVQEYLKALGYEIKEAPKQQTKQEHHEIKKS